MNPLVIKLGGALLDDHVALNNLFTAINQYKKTFNRPLIIVHGGGKLVDSLMDRLSLPVIRRNGLRVTPADQIDIIVGTLAGSANTTLLSTAKKHSLTAVGLTLADGNSVNVKQISAELGYVGEAEAGNPKLITALLKLGYLPIISSIGITDDGQMMNVNADHAAVAIAKTVQGDLVILSDVEGVLDADKNHIDILNEDEADQLIAKGVITGGMVVKVRSAFAAAKILGRPIDIASWLKTDELADLFNGKQVKSATRLIVQIE